MLDPLGTTHYNTA